MGTPVSLDMCLQETHSVSLVSGINGIGRIDRASRGAYRSVQRYLSSLQVPDFVPESPRSIQKSRGSRFDCAICPEMNVAFSVDIVQSDIVHQGDGQNLIVVPVQFSCLPNT